MFGFRIVHKREFLTWDAIRRGLELDKDRLYVELNEIKARLHRAERRADGLMNVILARSEGRVVALPEEPNELEKVMGMYDKLSESPFGDESAIDHSAANEAQKIEDMQKT